MELSFDPDFAGAADWARAYRSLGLQVVPARRPVEGEEWKRPLVYWKDHEFALVDDAGFESWFGPRGEFRRVGNLGFLTGSCSGNVGVIDLDDHKGGAAQAWLDMAIALNNGIMPKTLTQITGGGGRQLLFRWPPGVVIPTGKTKRGVDIRGQGGFAVLPPSRHISGKGYAWAPGYGPQDGMEIADLPLEWVELVEQLFADERLHPKAPPAPSAEIIQLPVGKTHTLAGEALDGREDYMTRLVWAAAADLRREHPMPPPAAVIETAISEAYRRYEAHVAPRGAALGEPKHVALDREGRGPSLFRQKFTYALSQWGGKLSEAAARREVISENGQIYDAATGEVVMPETDEFAAAPPRTLKLYSLDDLFNEPDPTFLVEELIIENGLGFLYGEPGCGKSFVALDLGRSLASGLQWMGRPVQQGGVLYLAGEGKAGAKHRTLAWANAKNQHARDVNFYMAFESLDFMRMEDVETLERTVEVILKQWGVGPCLIIVDTVSRVLPGAEENKQADMTLFIKACDRVRERYGCAVMGVHHASKANGTTMRGSTVLLGAADFAFSLEKVGAEDEEGGVIFTAQKIKDARDGWTAKLDLVEHAVGDLKGSKSLVPQMKVEPVVDLNDPKYQPLRKGWPSREVCENILADLREAADRKQPWSTHHNLIEKGKHALTNMVQRYGLKAETAKMMLATWSREGVITHKEKHEVQGWAHLNVRGYVVTGDLGDGRLKYEIARQRAEGEA